MGEPIVFVSHLKVKEGKLEALKEFSREGIKDLEADKPRTVVQLFYLDEDGTEMSVVHIFPDAEAFELHMEGVEERVAAAYEFVESRAVEIYGTPSDRVLESMRQVSTPGFSLTHYPEHLGGYLRLTTG